MTKKNSSFCPVYFFYGPEDYLIEEEIRKILHQTLSPKERGLNFHLFHGGEHRGQEIVQTAQTLPMFSDYRFVLVQEADLMEEEGVESLMRYLQRPSLSTCLVLHGQTIGPWKSYRKEIEKIGRVMEFTRLKGKALVSWMRAKIQEKGKILTEEASDYLVEMVGDHLHDLDHALEKAFLSVGEKQKIELSDVEEMTPNVKISTVFDLTDAIGQQNLERALVILEKALESGTIAFKKEEDPSKKDPVPILLSMMAKHYWNLLMVKQLISDHPDLGELSRELGSFAWNVKKWVEQGRNFSEAALREGIQKCHQADLAIKRSRGPKELLIEKLVMDLCRPR